MAIATRGFGGTHLITQGYGYTAIIIPVEVGGVVRPYVTYVKRKYRFPVIQLDFITEQIAEQMDVNALNIARFRELSRKCEELKLQIPKDIQFLIDDLTLIEEQGAKVNVNKLKTIKSIEIFESAEALKTMSFQEERIFMLFKLRLIKELKVKLRMQIPKDLKVEKYKKRAKYLEMLDLIDSLDEE